MRAGPSSPEQHFKIPRQGRDWISLLLIIAVAALLLTAGYFAFRHVDRSTFNDARAFRALDELVSQFENFQQTMASLLALVPEERSKWSKYEGTWALPRLTLSSFTPACSEKDESAARKTVKFVLQGRDPDLSFTVSRCVNVENEVCPTAQQFEKRGLAYHRLELGGSMNAQLHAFASQDFFDVAIIGSLEGELLLDIRKRGHTPGAVQLQQTRSTGVSVVNITDLLRRGALEIVRNRTKREQKDDAVNLPDPAAPSHPIVFEERIAGEAYRVYVTAFRPTIPIHMANRLPAENSAPALDRPAERSTLETLFIIGLKRHSWAEQMSAALGPSGRLTITFAALLAIVLWPLVSLRFAAPRDPIPHMQVVALATTALLLPAILAVAAMWMWNRLHLRIWADSGAEVYAQQIEAFLLADLNEGARLLAEYGPAIHKLTLPQDSAPGAAKPPSAFPSSKIRLPPGARAGHDPVSCSETSEAKLDDPVMLKARYRSKRCELLNWSPLRSISGLDAHGGRMGRRLTAFGALPYRKSLTLSDREYFQAIIGYEEWRPHDLWLAPSPPHGFVAQRLFSRADAARVLQIAVPIEHEGKRVGVAIGDTRAYGISSAIRVPLLRFAVVDASNGAVLFHSNDQRSLAENFLLETEHDPSLQRALSRRARTYTFNLVTREDHFSGEYMGTAHRFLYRPVAGVPWGIVVFYPTAEIATITQQAAIAALASYMCVIITVVVLMVIVFSLLPKRFDLILLSLLWPRWDARASYRALACCLVAILGTVVALLMWDLNGQIGPGVTLVIAAAAACLALCLSFWQAGRSKRLTLRTYQAWYLACMVLLMLLVSALPAAWLTTSYQDAALRGYLRDQLALAASDLEHRESRISRDLLRWMDQENGMGSDKYPTADALSRILSSPGYGRPEKKNDCTIWEVTAFDRRPWISASGPRRLGFFRRTVWAMSIDSNLQRAGRTTLAAPSGPDSKLASDPDNTAASEPDMAPANSSAAFGSTAVSNPAAHRSCGRDPTSVPQWHRSFNGKQSQLKVPIAAQQPQKPLPPQQPPRKFLERDSDVEIHYRYSSTIAAVVLFAMLLVALTLVSWTVARRLLGIRIPFASRYVDPDSSQSMPVAPLLDVELHIAALERQEGAKFTVKDGDDIRMARCKDIYRQIWKKRSQDECLLLHQLAEGKFANPENRFVIENLLHLGYVKLDPWPKIADRGLAEFARHAEKDSLFEKWQRAASSSTWNRIRTPLLLLLIVVVGLLMWVAGSTMQILSATLAGMATLFGYITQVTSLFKRSSQAPGAE